MKKSKMNKIVSAVAFLCLIAMLLSMVPYVSARNPEQPVDTDVTVETTEAIPETTAETIPEIVETEPIVTEPEVTEPPKPVVFGEDIYFESEYIDNGETMPYLQFTPSTANDGGDIPLIVWLHGSGERGVGPNTFQGAGLPCVLYLWTWEGFNAYVICPQLTGKWNPGVWSCDASVKNVQNLIDSFVATHNVDTEKIIITGHSLGGQGALYMALKLPEYFSKMAVLSGYPINGDISEINIPTLGFVENSGTSRDYMVSTFKSVFGEEATVVYNDSHGAIPRVAFNEDKDENNRSDLIEWMLED